MEFVGAGVVARAEHIVIVFDASFKKVAAALVETFGVFGCFVVNVYVGGITENRCDFKPLAVFPICFLNSSLRRMCFKKSRLNNAGLLRRNPKQKEFRYIGSEISQVTTDVKPHSFGVSEEPVNRISPF